MTFYKKRWFWFVTAIFLAIITIIILRKTFTYINVRVEPVRRQTLTITVTATSTGTIKSDNEAKITAKRTGRVTGLLFDEGDIVKAGAVVAELDKEEAYYNMKMAEAALQKAESIYSNLNASYDSFRVDVERNIDKARATLSEVGSRRKRFMDLHENGYVTEMDVEAVQKEYDIAKANLSSAIASKGLLKAKADEIKAQEAAVREARNNLSLAHLNYEYSLVKSPISGVITSRPVKLGEGVAKGGVIATVVSTESMYVEAFIDEADVAKVRVGQRVNITMDAYPQRVFAGEVYRISPVVLGGKQETRTFEVRVRFKEDGAVIKPGMSADIEIIVESIENVLIVPSQAVIERDGKRYVYIIKDSKAQLVNVETGRFNWNFTEIRSGIKEGEEIIVNTDVSGLKNGVRVHR
ncbi:MAG: efflux RND transporter periplasmic adaptor subunit [Thermodesulfovibrionales bacterium]